MAKIAKPLNTTIADLLKLILWDYLILFLVQSIKEQCLS